MSLEWKRRALVVLSLLVAPVAWAAAPDTGIVERDAQVEGGTLHYLKAGDGPAVILLHGYTQTSACGGRSS
jgi:hypothetical protein